MAEYSINVEQWDETWNYVGRELEISKRGEWSERRQNGVGEDDYYPMMNYCYPLYKAPTDSEIFKVHRLTSCTVVEKDGDYYLALTGGGMDLSQDIALAYYICQRWIPYELAIEVNTQPNLSQYGIYYRRTMRAVKDSLRENILSARRKIKEINKGIKESMGDKNGQ